MKGGGPAAEQRVRRLRRLPSSFGICRVLPAGAIPVFRQGLFRQGIQPPEDDALPQRPRADLEFGQAE